MEQRVNNRNVKKLGNPAIAVLILIVSGCATAPSVMPKSEQTQYPTLHRAMQNTSEVDHWKGCAGESGNHAKNCQAEFLYQSVGPAPMLAAAIGERHTLNSSWPISDALDAAIIANGISFSGFASLAIPELLIGGSSPDLSGLHGFHSGAYLYAVHFEPSRSAANAFFAQAAMVEAEAPAKIGGSVVGRTSYHFNGATWEPHEKKWNTDTGGSMGLFYKVRPVSTDPVMQPDVVWETMLNPLMNAYALTDQWKLHGEATRKVGNEEAKALSPDFPGWIFVVGGGDEKPLICVSGTCHFGPRVVRAASIS